MVEGVVGKPDALGALGDANSRIRSNGSPADIEVRLHIAAQNLSPGLLLDLHHELVKIPLVLLSVPILQLYGYVSYHGCLR